ncbi:MAG: penicillin acylase family protein [Planctomycetes bacterium]|nr:penicillin acylase family protein [Planctomycetota bacterium]
MMGLNKDVLRRLGGGESVQSVCAAERWSLELFMARWREETRIRCSTGIGSVAASVRNSVSIERDRRGIPHIFAANSSELWFGFGFAMAQDRFFQLDYLRRKGWGQLSEVLGRDGLNLDLVARIVGLNRIARAEWSTLPPETQELLTAFSQGVNAWLGSCPPEQLPIEFALLDYSPRPWEPVDCLAIENEFRWYLTGRFPVIVMPELARRVLGDGMLYQEFLVGEADDEAVVPADAYQELKRRFQGPRWGEGHPPLPFETVGQAVGDPDGSGSNNWVIGGRHCQAGLPLLASDPHIALEAVSCWYEVHLCGGEFDVAGIAYVGMPAVLFGRNRRVAWGATNNICSQRDLYQEHEDPNHLGCFEYAGTWEPARVIRETIDVRGEAAVVRDVRFSRNGPIVDEILPPPGDRTGPVALKWLGAHHGGWLTAQLQMDRAGSVAQFREALRPWHVPTFNLVIADVDGNIAVQCAGRIPLRATSERGYRAGWDPGQQWQGLLPFEMLPHSVNHPRGWYASANNRLAANDYPYPLFGTWISGYRAERIRGMIEERLQRAARNPADRFTIADCRDMQYDSLTLRWIACREPLLAVLDGASDSRERAALAILRDWDGRVEADHPGPALFNVFFTYWTQAATEVHFSGAAAELLARQVDVVAGRLLAADPHQWFPEGTRVPAIRAAFARAVNYLHDRFGVELPAWGRLHRCPLVHWLAMRGDLGTLLNHGGGPVRGDMLTVCNTGSGPDWLATTGAGYRMIADLATPRLLAIDGQSQSGNVGDAHYSDQMADWNAGQYHWLSLDRDEIRQQTTRVQQLVPR